MDDITRQFFNLVHRIRAGIRKSLTELKLIENTSDPDSEQYSPDPASNKPEDQGEILAAIESLRIAQGSAEAKKYALDHRRYRLEWKGNRVAKYGLYVLVVYASLTAVIAIYSIRSANAAKSAADTARDALVKVQRAFVYPDNIKIVQLVNGVRFIVIWKNSGNTPTKDLIMHDSFDDPVDVLPSNFAFPDMWIKGRPQTAGKQLVIWPNSVGGSEVGGETADKLKEWSFGKRHLYFWGWAKYHDIFDGTPEHVTRFCTEAVYGGISPQLPANSPKQLASLAFVNCDRNNCYDEQCTKQ